LRRAKLLSILMCYGVPTALHKYAHQFMHDGFVQKTNTTLERSIVLGLFPCHSSTLPEHLEKRLILNDSAITTTLTTALIGRTFGKIISSNVDQARHR